MGGGGDKIIDSKKNFIERNSGKKILKKNEFKKVELKKFELKKD